VRCAGVNSVSLTVTCLDDGVRRVLPLDSPTWGNLAHAYGRANDIPALLRVLAERAGDVANAWDELWGSLCHQGDTCSAAYSAVPHIVAIAKGMTRDQRLEHLHFVGAIARAEADVPPALDADYRAALADALRMVEDALAAHPNEGDAACLLWVAVAVRELEAAARALDTFADGSTIQTRCPVDHCGVSLWLDHDGVHRWRPLVLEDEPDGDSTEIRPPVRRDDGAEWTDQTAPARMARLAEKYGYPDLAAKLDLLMGMARCPHCGEEFPLWPEILDPSDL